MSKAFFSADLQEWTLNELLFSCCEMPVDEALYKLCFRHSSRIVSVSHSKLQEVKTAFPDLPASRVSVIPNGVDFEKIEAAKRDWKKTGLANDTDILFSGRLACLKGTSKLIKAISILRIEIPRIRVKVVGTGPLSQRLRERTRALGLSENVQFLGHLSLHDLISQIMRTSTVVLPSYYEGNPISVLEAMACGKPVVAFDYPFSREVIEDGHTGLLATVGDCNDLAEKLRVLLDDRRLCGTLANNAFEYVFKKHNWETLADSYAEMYRDLK
jgi:glycosyltransferase involved in cell wall biosynthesis